MIVVVWELVVDLFDLLDGRFDMLWIVDGLRWDG